MSVICVIPARYHSTRFPGKLLVNVLGKSLLQRTYESALLSSAIDEIYIATDSIPIKTHMESIGAKVLFTSSQPINGTERIIEAMEHFEPLQKAEVIVNLQGDHPCTPPKTIEKTIQALLANPTSSIATAARPAATQEELLAPQMVKCVLNSQGSALYFSRSPIPYHAPNAPLAALIHLGIYCYRPSFLQQLATLPPTPLQKKEDLEQLQFLEQGFPIQVAIVEEGSLSVDIPQDLKLLEEYLLGLVSCHKK
ncbi:MAG: 3-deoxy-manno-octulosonate cytidylyltransferase [Chlamydiia bacterium]|nr:3-deoxy-manno-octulosonate cytidylyltransferase [Chlamydiia bacterium]